MLPPVLLIAVVTEGVLKKMGIAPSQQEIFNTLADSRMDAVTQTLLIFCIVVVAPFALYLLLRQLLDAHFEEVYPRYTVRSDLSFSVCLNVSVCLFRF